MNIKLLKQREEIVKSWSGEVLLGMLLNPETIREKNKKFIYIKNKNSIMADSSFIYGRNQCNIVIIF